MGCWRASHSATTVTPETNRFRQPGTASVVRYSGSDTGRETAAVLLFRPLAPGMKIFCPPGTKKKICKHCEQQTMYNQLMQRMEGAKDYVVCDPNQGKPACPVTAAEHEHSANNRHETDEADPHDVILKRMLWLELDKMVSKSDGARYCEYATDDGDGEWTFVHGVSMCGSAGRWG
jgi:hypothetical protein